MVRGTKAVHAATAAQYHAAGWWTSASLADRLAVNAAAHPDGLAYVTARAKVSWAQVEAASDGLAGALAATGAEPGDRVAVWLPDGPTVHVAFLAAEKAGLVVVGLGARAGRREVAHLLARTGAKILVTGGEIGPTAGVELVADLRRDGADVRHVTMGDAAGEMTHVDVDGQAVACAPLPPAERARRRLGPDDVFLINSTSGTTGMPKCVVHNENRWHHFHQRAVANGALTSDDVFLGAVPAPFGFGLWTSHVTPITLGAPTVLLDRFDPGEALVAMERERVTVLCCVSTQFIMMLGAPELDHVDLSSLRVMFTGGEAVPYERARAFEERTGCTILQFYGSNETGLLSGTTLADPPERRLRTAGRLIPEMQVRLFDEGRDVTAGGRGQPGCKGPATSLGYLDDDEANAALLTEDGWMLMGDIVEVDDEGWLTVVGRTSDLIIRGGKNISAAQVEADVATHPDVAHAAVVAMPDPIFGERICAYVELRSGATLTLDELVAHLAAQGVSKELRPERLVEVDELPRSSGAKVAKGELRADIQRRLAAEGVIPAEGAPTPPTRRSSDAGGAMSATEATEVSSTDGGSAEPRAGGTAVWAPSVMPPIGVDLTDEQALACSYRILAAEGFSENIAGHITWQRPGQTNMLVNPWGLWWEEISASDVCEVDEDANVVAGRWDVTPAIHIHTELHRARPDARVVIHNHPYHVCVLAALGMLPELLHQTGSMFLGDLRVVEEYTGEVDSPDLGADLADMIGSASVAILANHGVIVTGGTVAEAAYRAATIDRVCRLAYDVLVTGREPRRMGESVMVGIKASLLERGVDVYWNGAVRALLRREPDVLD